jgi:LPXTG-motif cell wall-anchored protein
MNHLKGKMKNSTLRKVAAFAIAGALLTAGPAMAATAPTPTINYTMKNTLNGLAGNPALVAAPTCSNPGVEDNCNTSTNFGTDSNGNFFHWVTTQGNGGGLVLTTAQPLGDSYTMTIKFAVDALSNDEDGISNPANGYSKLIDFKDLTDDEGLYFNNGDHYLITNSSDPGDGTFAAGDVVTMTIVRDATPATPTFTVYAKDATNANAVQFTMDDPSGLYVAESHGAGSILHLFQDEPETATNGNSHEGVQEGRLYGFEAWPGVALTEEQINASATPVTKPSTKPTLAETGATGNANLAIGGVLALLGLSLMLVARRRDA